jgi:hypothetical protein
VPFSRQSCTSFTRNRCEYCGLLPSQLAILGSTSRTSNVEHEPRHWFIRFEDLDVYHDSLALPQESAIYSPSGNWAIIFSTEDHAVLGAQDDFFNVFESNVWESLDQQLSEFVSLWRENLTRGIDSGWIPGLLRHVYGPERSDQIIADLDLAKR